MAQSKKKRARGRPPKKGRFEVVVPTRLPLPLVKALDSYAKVRSFKRSKAVRDILTAHLLPSTAKTPTAKTPTAKAAEPSKGNKGSRLAPADLKTSVAGGKPKPRRPVAGAVKHSLRPPRKG